MPTTAYLYIIAHLSSLCFPMVVLSLEELIEHNGLDILAWFSFKDGGPTLGKCSQSVMRTGH